MFIGVTGEYGVDIKENGRVVKSLRGKNHITTAGFGRIADWLCFNFFGSGYFHGLKKIDTTGMTVTNAGFTNPYNAIDGDTASYTYATIDGTSWDNDYWQIDFGASKTVMAVRVNWVEDDSNRSPDYKFQYSADASTWTDIDTRLRPPADDGTRGNVLFYLSPDMAPVSARYFRLNTHRNDDTDTLYLYELEFFEPNCTAQPPMVMRIGDGTTTPSETDTVLSGTNTVAKGVISITKPESKKVRFIAFLDANEGNGITFSEAGMFFYPTDNHTKQTISNATTMFSRGLLDSSFSKTSAQTADVWYEITLSNVG